MDYFPSQRKLLQTKYFKYTKTAHPNAVYFPSFKNLFEKDLALESSNEENFVLVESRIFKLSCCLKC